VFGVRNIVFDFFTISPVILVAIAPSLWSLGTTLRLMKNKGRSAAEKRGAFFDAEEMVLHIGFSVSSGREKKGALFLISTG